MTAGLRRDDEADQAVPGPAQWIGPYRLVQQLGEGGMGVVYRARDRESSVPVALKTMAHVEPTALLRFKNEFRALAWAAANETARRLGWITSCDDLHEAVKLAARAT
jgi:serine/threonine protein kinase